MHGIGGYTSRVAHSFPKRTAIIDQRNGMQITYGDLDRETESLAAAFLGLGLTQGDRLGAWMQTSLDYVKVYLAAAKAGLVIVPINDRLQPAEADHIVADSQIRALVYSPQMRDKVAELSGLGSLMLISGAATDSLATESLEAMLSRSCRATLPPVGWDLLFAMAYTSGTTGLPKGALLTHENVHQSNVSNAISYRLPRFGVSVYSATMTFAGTVLGHLLPQLMTGSTILMTGAPDPERIVDTVLEYGAHFANVPVPLIAAVNELLKERESTLPSLVTLLQSGGKADPAILSELNERLDARLVLAWGMTEVAACAASATSASDMRRALAGETHILSTVGRASTGVTVAQGENSELLLNSRALTSGYWNRPTDTAAAFKNGWYYSGDLGSIDDEGLVTISDRRLDLIVSGGANVYPSEVERVVREVPGVADVVVVGIPHDRWGQTVAAVVVRAPSSSVDEEAVIQHCREKLADYKKPRHVLFIEELPREVTGKIMRRKVRDLAEADA